MMNNVNDNLYCYEENIINENEEILSNHLNNLRFIDGKFITNDGEIITLKKIKEIREKEIIKHVSDEISDIESLGLKSDLIIKKRYYGIERNVVNVKEGFNFTKVFYPSLQWILKNMKLSAREHSMLLVCISFLNFGEGAVVINGSYPTIEEIGELIGIKERTTRDIINSLEDKLLIITNIHNNRRVIYPDPFLFCRGLVDICTLKMFSDSPFNPYNNNYFKKKRLNKFDKSDKDEKVLEKDIENMLINNISLIEDGMTYIDKQVQVANGKIDILAKDNNDKTCIIEVKNVDNCKDLVFQCMYYPTQFEDDVRMIAICPGYSNKIKTALQNTNTEMYEFELIEENLLNVFKVS